jgi:hypothetical protein
MPNESRSRGAVAASGVQGVLLPDKSDVVNGRRCAGPTPQSRSEPTYAGAARPVGLSEKGARRAEQRSQSGSKVLQRDSGTRSAIVEDCIGAGETINQPRGTLGSVPSAQGPFHLAAIQRNASFAGERYLRPAAGKHRGPRQRAVPLQANRRLSAETPAGRSRGRFEICRLRKVMAELKSCLQTRTGEGPRYLKTSSTYFRSAMDTQ